MLHFLYRNYFIPFLPYQSRQGHSVYTSQASVVRMRIQNSKLTWGTPYLQSHAEAPERSQHGAK